MVCASLGCKTRVGVYHCSCPMWVSGLLSVLHPCLILISVSYELHVLPISVTVVILVFSLLVPDCWCVCVYMSLFLALHSASVALCVVVR